MRSPYETRIAENTEIQRQILQGSATICSCPFGDAWRGIFKAKAAEELAARTGCSVRTAAYQLSGEHPPSGKALVALMIEVTPDSK